MGPLAPLKVLLMLAALVGAAQCAAPTGFVLPAPAAYGLRSPAIITRSSSTLDRPATMLSAEKGGLGGFFSSISEKLPSFEVSTPDFTLKGTSLVKGTETIVKKEEDKKEEKEDQAEKKVGLFNTFLKEFPAKEKKEEMSAPKEETKEKSPSASRSDPVPKAKTREPLRPSENTKSVETRAATASKTKTETVSNPKKEVAKQIRASVKSSRAYRAPLRGTATDERPGSQAGYQFTEEEIRARKERDAKAKQEIEAKREKAKAKKDAEFAVRQELFGTQRQPLQLAAEEGKRPGSTKTVQRLPEPKDPSLPWLQRYLPAMWNAVPENQSMNPSFFKNNAALAEDARVANVNIAAPFETGDWRKGLLSPFETGGVAVASKTKDTQAPPPAKLELPKAKLEALEVNKKQLMSESVGPVTLDPL